LGYLSRARILAAASGFRASARGSRKRTGGGGVVADIGGHVLDTALYLMGYFEVASVFAQTHAKFGARALANETGQERD